MDPNERPQLNGMDGETNHEPVSSKPYLIEDPPPSSLFCSRFYEIRSSEPSHTSTLSKTSLSIYIFQNCPNLPPAAPIGYKAHECVAAPVHGVTLAIPRKFHRHPRSGVPSKIHFLQLHLGELGGIWWNWGDVRTFDPGLRWFRGFRWNDRESVNRRERMGKSGEGVGFGGVEVRRMDRRMDGSGWRERTY